MITISDFSNPKYTDESGDAVDLDIDTNLHGVIPTTFKFSETDTYPHEAQIREWLIANIGSIAAYVAPPPVVINNSIISKLAAMRELKSRGEWAPIRAALASNEDLSEEWQATTVLDINDPAIATVKTLLSWTDEEKQQFFNDVGA